MRLPPVDIYRAPFVLPLGHLTMQAAYADLELIGLCAIVPFEGSDLQMQGVEVAARLRNWGPSTVEFVVQRLLMIGDENIRSQAMEAFQRFQFLREQRHRMIHDAIELGLFEEPGGYEVGALQVQYIKAGKGNSVRQLERVSPEAIAALACEFYELHKDLDAVVYGLRVRDA